MNNSASRTPTLAPTLAGCAALAAVLLLLITVLAPVQATAAPARLVSQSPQFQTGQGSNTDPNVNYVSQYLAAKGYEVLDAGYLQNKDGSIDRTSVAVVMTFASSKFDPNTQKPYEDQDTVTQVVLGYYALHKYFIKAENLIVGLAYQNSYIFVFPSTAAAWQTVLDDNTKADAFWQTVSSNFVILDSNGNQVDSNDFGSKNFGGGDFSGQGGNNGPTPPTNDPTNNPVDPAAKHDPGAGYIRLIPSSAYLPNGSNEFYLIGTVSDKNSMPASGQKVAFTARATGQQEQAIGNTQTTDNNGTARVQVNRSSASGEITVRAYCAASNDPTSCGDVTVDGPASAVLLVGSSNLSSEQGKQALANAMQAQGYSVQEVDYQESKDVTGETVAQAVLAMDMASKRFDQTLRSQMFSGFGTMFTVFPRSTTGILAFLYISGGKPYFLIYSLNRTDWQAFVQGKIDEAAFWKQVSLNGVVDAKTGEQVGGNSKDFVDKNFSGQGSNGSAGTGIARPRSVESKLVVEEWGPQPYDDNIVVPIGGYADNFKATVAGSGAKDWGIYPVEDTSTPIYRSKDDSGGAKLKNLKLGAGNYILMVEDPNPPDNTAQGTIVESVKLDYIERLP